MYSKDRDQPLEIIGQDVEANFRSDVFQGLYKEVRRSHSGCERAKWKLDGLSANPHGVRPAIEAPTHRFDDRFMFPSLDPAFLAGRALVMQRAGGASIRDIARRADVGLATLLRHYPTREALLEALLCTNLDALTQKADELETSNARGEALVTWFSEWVAFALGHRGVVALMAAAHTNPDSALYASCAAVHSASARLLLRAQSEGTARADMNGDDLFALMSAGRSICLPSRPVPIISLTS